MLSYLRGYTQQLQKTWAIGLSIVPVPIQLADQVFDSGDFVEMGQIYQALEQFIRHKQLWTMGVEDVDPEMRKSVIQAPFNELGMKLEIHSCPLISRESDAGLSTCASATD